MVVENDFFILRKFLQILIKKGKKAKALKVFLNLLKNLKQNEINSSLTSRQIISKSFLNARPLLHVKKVRKSSKVFYLPKIINTEQKISLSVHWLIKSVNARKEKTLEERLQNEFLDCFSNKGLTINKKQALYDVILVNRPFLNLLVYK